MPVYKKYKCCECEFHFTPQCLATKCIAHRSRNASNTIASSRVKTAQRKKEITRRKSVERSVIKVYIELGEKGYISDYPAYHQRRVKKARKQGNFSEYLVGKRLWKKYSETE